MDNKCLFKSEKCGAFKKLNDDQLYYISNLNESTKAHLIKLKLLKKRKEELVTEKLLIESRSGIEIKDGTSCICSYHRYLFPSLGCNCILHVFCNVCTFFYFIKHDYFMKYKTQNAEILYNKLERNIARLKFRKNNLILNNP